MYLLFILNLLLTIMSSNGKKPHYKREQAIWKVECMLGVIVDPDCPVDGGWSSWGPWSACHGPCDDIGHKQRSRECMNPPPSKEGSLCIGSAIQTDTCYISNCTVDDFRRLFTSDLLRSKALDQLEAVPALLGRCLQAECNFEAIQAALATENTWQLDSESLWNSLQCVKHNMGCPLAGSWGNWGTWSTCSAQCGRGVRSRLRRCDSPPPSSPHLICDGDPLQSENCDGDHCAIDENGGSTDVGGSWSAWGGWIPCSEQCGAGVKQRKRICFEKHSTHGSDTWGTHCRGPHEEIETCFNYQCILDGGWVGWSTWGPCSQICGAGRRTRVRSCTRPVASGHGATCNGPRTEVGSCYLTPCDAYIHHVAVFNGEGYLHYNLENKHSTLLHMYIRFKPLSQYGTLFRRGTVQGPIVRVSLQKWHVCVDVSGEVPSCSLPRLCTMTTLEPDTWHSVMVSITTEAVSLHLDNFQPTLRTLFPCDPYLVEEQLNFKVGERFYGEIQEVAVNFIPLNLVIEGINHAKHSLFTPSSASNIAYEKSSIDEAFVTFFGDEYIRIPCFEDQDEWSLEAKVKTKKESGVLFYLGNHRDNNWLLVTFQNSRVKLKVSVEDIKSESSTSTEYPPEEWLDIHLTKKRNGNAIEAKLNGDERLHVKIMEKIERNRRNRFSRRINESCRSFNNVDHKEQSVVVSTEIPVKEISKFTVCNDEFYVGGLPDETKLSLSEDIIGFTGTLASLAINNILQDLFNFGMERNNGDLKQMSSRTASISGSYHETFWGKSKKLNLTCLHARTGRAPNSAQWLLLDTTIIETFSGKKIRSTDDGRVLRLSAYADSILKGFYTCRAHGKKITSNIVTYGVIGKSLQDLRIADTTTVVAVCSTLILLFVTFGCLIIEGINDLRNGFGFFRDQILSPQEEAEAICSFIDNNTHLVESSSAIKIAKARARRTGRQLSRQMCNNDPSGVITTPIKVPSDDSTGQSELETLPALPEIAKFQSAHEIYRCELSFVSSPRHGSKINSPGAKLSSSSTFEISSPRVLCSRLMTSHCRFSPRQNYISWRKGSRSTGMSLSPRNNTNIIMPTIKSSGHINMSPAQKILQKFQQLT